jgi:hypothetical protein
MVVEERALVSESKPVRGNDGDGTEPSGLSLSQLSTFSRECRDRGYQLRLSPREPRAEFPGVIRYDVMIGGREVWHGYLTEPYGRALERATRELRHRDEALAKRFERVEIQPLKTGRWRRLGRRGSR